jgi:pyruvate dehydrogenase E1 component
VIVVTSPDLLVGNLAHQTGYQYLIEELGVNSTLYAQRVLDAEIPTVAGLRIPIVSVHDGEPGLLDNIGSIVGVKQICLAVRKHSKCGRPSEIYHFHEIDFEAVENACITALEHTAREVITLR